MRYIPVQGLGVEDSAAITEVVRRRVLKLFKRKQLLLPEDIEAMLSWDKSGFLVNYDQVDIEFDEMFDDPPDDDWDQRIAW